MLKNNGYKELIQQQFSLRYVNPQITGEGAFSKVFKCQNQQGEFVAIKVVNLLGVKSCIIPYLKNEIRLLHQSDNDNVIKLYESQETDSALFLVLEYCEMDVKTMMAIYFQNKLPEELVIVIFKQLVNGLHYLHSNKIIHRDLKLENIGVIINGEDQDKLKNLNQIQKLDIFLNASYKLLDLGLAKQFQEQTVTVTYAGTEVNMAPEVLQRKPYSFEADIYSLGVCLYQMITGEYPYYDKLNRKQQFELIQEQNAKYQMIQNQTLREIVSSMLKYNVEDRLTFQQLYQQPLLYSSTTNFQSILEKSLIKNSEFYSLENSFVKQQQLSNQGQFNNQGLNFYQNQLFHQFQSKNLQQSQSYQDQFFQSIQSNTQNQQFQIIEQKIPPQKSQIGKPKSKSKIQQETTQIQQWNNTLNQCILVQKISEKLLDLMLSIPQEFKYHSFNAQFQEYLEYFCLLYNMMRNQLKKEVEDNNNNNQNIKEYKDIRDSLLKLDDQIFDNFINDQKFSKAIYQLRKLIGQMKSLQEVREINGSQSKLVENIELVYIQILRILQDVYYKEIRLNKENINLEQFNCKVYQLLIVLALLRAGYNNQSILTDIQIDNLKGVDSINDPDQLCYQLSEILDKYQLSFSKEIKQSENSIDYNQNQ
ncbi:unnamed protein product [Paramecium sonneborni]|uniref:Protein kinase domain-containing protein n=1 Tax=Paramecium sonneborni TaxID=65129 RepID=A0A8S1NU00_9CILI|nr:unnamed protein product [Paramecium sonneborni]